MVLGPADKERLIRIIEFLENEINDVRDKFQGLDFKTYSKNREAARNAERCIENIVNSSMDAAKIIIVDEKLTIPETYREYFLTLCSAGLINEDTANKLADGVRMRNILAHQYLDIRWDKIKKFIQSDWQVYEVFIDTLKKYVS